MSDLPTAPEANSRLTLKLAGISCVLALGLIGTLAVCVFWAVDRIDMRASKDQRVAIEAALRQELVRLVVEQDSSAAWDDAVVKVREGDQEWIAQNLVEWMSSFFHHDRVYPH